MNGSFRGLASCKEERRGDPYEAVSCAELLDTARRLGKSLPLAVALRIAEDVLDGLERRAAEGGAADERSVSLGSVFVGPRGDVQVHGTPAERAAGALDQLEGEPGPVFSMGAVLYELLTGREPVLFDDGPESGPPSYRGDLSAIAEPTARLPLELRLLLASALAREPDERFREARDFADAIRSFAHHARIRLDRTAFAAWLATLDLWPDRGGTFPRSELSGYAETPAGEHRAGGARVR